MSPHSFDNPPRSRNPQSKIVGWGPLLRRGAFSVSFDNLGEAAALERGELVIEESLGTHYTALDVIRRLVALLGDTRATYFIEASNALLYPLQIQSWRDAGHETGIHGWRHEHWGRLAAEERRSSLRRSIDAFRSIGIPVSGFRPPGGIMPNGSNSELEDIGLTYCSPLGEEGGSTMRGRLAHLPFVWKHVDAYQLDPELSAFRQRFGDSASPTSVDEWEAVLHMAMSHAVGKGVHVTVIFHPYLFGRDVAMFTVLERLLRKIERDGDLWVAPCGEVASWLKARAGE